MKRKSYISTVVDYCGCGDYSCPSNNMEVPLSVKPVKRKDAKRIASLLSNAIADDTWDGKPRSEEEREDSIRYALSKAKRLGIELESVAFGMTLEKELIEGDVYLVFAS